MNAPARIINESYNERSTQAIENIKNPARLRLLNARIGLSAADERWNVTLFGRNLGNEYYVSGTFNPGDTISRYTGMPRTFGLTLTYKML